MSKYYWKFPTFNSRTSVPPSLIPTTFISSVLWESETATDKEVNLKEVEYIRYYKSNDSCIGYNQSQKMWFKNKITKFIKKM